MNDEIEVQRLHKVLYEMMDTGFRSGERYVYADDLAYLLGTPFTFENEDGTQTTFDGSQSWLRDYPWRQNDLGLALTEWEQYRSGQEKPRA